MTYFKGWVPLVFFEPLWNSDNRTMHLGKRVVRLEVCLCLSLGLAERDKESWLLHLSKTGFTGLQRDFGYSGAGREWHWAGAVRSYQRRSGEVVWMIQCCTKVTVIQTSRLRFDSGLDSAKGLSPCIHSIVRSNRGSWLSLQARWDQDPIEEGPMKVVQITGTRDK